MNLFCRRGSFMNRDTLKRIIAIVLLGSLLLGLIPMIALATEADATIRQTVWLYSDSRRIDFVTEIDWHAHHQVLKVAFPLDVLTDTATLEARSRSG